MIPPTDNDKSSGFIAPEFLGGIPAVLNMNDGLQSAYANQMNANAEHRREETRALKQRNIWEVGKLMLSGFVLFVLIFSIGAVFGAMIW
jgi:hypothetical protein